MDVFSVGDTEAIEAHLATTTRRVIVTQLFRRPVPFLGLPIRSGYPRLTVLYAPKDLGMEVSYPYLLLVLRCKTEVTLLHERLGHDDAVLAIELCDDGISTKSRGSEGADNCDDKLTQRWLLSVGADRIVKVWSLDLRRLGQLTSVRRLSTLIDL